jgi:hypothetical protein
MFRPAVISHQPLQIGLQSGPELLHDARQFNNGLVRMTEASGASVPKDVENQLLSAAPVRIAALIAFANGS